MFTTLKNIYSYYLLNKKQMGLYKFKSFYSC